MLIDISYPVNSTVVEKDTSFKPERIIDTCCMRQWNDPLEFSSNDKLLPKKGVATPHEYLVECYHYPSVKQNGQIKKMCFG